MVVEKLNKYQQILATALTKAEWLAQDTSDKAKYIRPQSRGIKVAKDLLQQGKLEKSVRNECNDYMRKQLRFQVVTLYTGGIPTGGGKLATNPAKGIPDTLVFNLFKKIKFWVEYKRNDGGIISQAQLNMHAFLKACGDIVIVTTSLPDLKSQLVRYGI